MKNSNAMSEMTMSKALTAAIHGFGVMGILNFGVGMFMDTYGVVGGAILAVAAMSTFAKLRE